MEKSMNGFASFQGVDIRVGTILEVNDFPEARKPAYKLTIDLGSEIGTKRSSAQIVDNYTKEHLIGKQVLCLVNVSPRQIGPFRSEVLTLGIPDQNGNVVLIEPGMDVPIGGKLY
jgi:tRNA-binding protein